MSEMKYGDLTRELDSFRPVEWELIPDFGLYMDQVITFLERQYKRLYHDGERIFTPAMVNNYVKMGLVDRPVGKKYGREQLAQLLMICMLKQAASAEGMRRLLKPAPGQSPQALYESFRQMQADVFAELKDREAPAPAPMTVAVRCAAYRFLCNSILTADTPASEPSKEDHPDEAAPKPEAL